MSPIEHNGRALLQTTASPIEVSTPEEFLSAIEDRALDILIIEHMDLTTLPWK
jgi:hypothetical protein